MFDSKFNSVPAKNFEAFSKWELLVTHLPLPGNNADEMAVSLKTR
jgi:hypothetical protein